MYGLNNGIPVSLKSIPSFGIAPQNQLTAAIQSLFWDGSQGWWYDDDDTSTLFQDSAGTTPVTAVEQFVGLQLDKSKGLVLGPELVTNGDFSNGTTGWTPVNGTLSVVSNQLVITQTTGSFAGANTTLSGLTIGRMYKITATVVSLSSATNTQVWVGSPASSVQDLNRNSEGISVPYTRSYVFFAGATSRQLQFVLNATLGVMVIDNISVRELPGNHRYAPASGNRPIWSKRVNLLTKTEQFNDAAWGKTGATITANATIAPDGTATADKLVEVLAANTPRVSQSTATVSGVSYVYSFYLKAAERSQVRLVLQGSSARSAYFNAATGATLPGISATATMTLEDNGWYRCVLEYVASAANSDAYIATAENDAPVSSGDPTKGIFIWGADFRPANQATGTIPLYQRVNTSSDYDTNGFPGYLRADGIDDFLQTNTINFGDGPTNPPLGPELVTNGDFSAGTTGWTASNSALTINSGALRVTNNTGGDASPRAYQAIALTLGRTYKITGTIPTQIAGGVNLGLNNSGDATVTQSIGTVTATGAFSFIYTVSAAANSFVVRTPGNIGSGGFFDIDNVSVKEITNANLGADKVTLCAGVRKLSDAALGVFTELSAVINTNAGSFLMSAPQSASTTIAFNSRGSGSIATAIDATIAAPITNVLTGIGEISTDTSLLRINGTQVATSSTDQGTGNYGNYPAYFFRRGGTTLPFNGYEYSNIAVGKLLTASQLASLEQYMNEKTRAY